MAWIPMDSFVIMENYKNHCMSSESKYVLDLN